MAEHGHPERLRGGVPRPRPRAFHVMAKPAGPACNLHCTYCFYLEKERLYPSPRRFRMSDAVLEAFIKQYIEAQQVPTISFAWQGGEPTLMGLLLPPCRGTAAALPAARQAPDQRPADERHPPHRRVVRVSARAPVSGGLSLDGPTRPARPLSPRPARRAQLSTQVMRGLRRLQQHGVVQLLCAVNPCQRPAAPGRLPLLRETGARHASSSPSSSACRPTASPGQPPSSREVSEASVRPAE